MKCQNEKCQAEFTPTNRRGPAPKYCSARCKQAQYRADKQSGNQSKLVAQTPRPQTKTAEPVTPGGRSEPKPSVTQTPRPDPGHTPYDSNHVTEMLQYHIDCWTESEAKYRAMGEPYKFLADMYKALVEDSVEYM